MSIDRTTQLGTTPTLINATPIHYCHVALIQLGVRYIAMASVSTSECNRKRVVLVISDKLKICQLVKGGRILQSVADKYNVGKSTVHDIVKSEKKLQAFQKEIEDGDCIKKRKTVKKADLS